MVRAITLLGLLSVLISMASGAHGQEVEMPERTQEELLLREQQLGLPNKVWMRVYKATDKPVKDQSSLESMILKYAELQQERQRKKALTAGVLPDGDWLSIEAADEVPTFYTTTMKGMAVVGKIEGGFNNGAKMTMSASRDNDWLVFPPLRLRERSMYVMQFEDDYLVIWMGKHHPRDADDQTVVSAPVEHKGLQMWITMPRRNLMLKDGLQLSVHWKNVSEKTLRVEGINRSDRYRVSVDNFVIREVDDPLKEVSTLELKPGEIHTVSIQSSVERPLVNPDAGTVSEPAVVDQLNRAECMVRVSLPELSVKSEPVMIKVIYPAFTQCHIQKGETLAGIAQRYLGDADRYKDILVLNPSLDPMRLRVNQAIYVPLE